MPSIHILCPDCGGSTIPKIVLERWERRRYLQCLACGQVWSALTTPADDTGTRWTAELRRVSDEYAFDIRRIVKPIDTPETYF